MQTYTGNLSPLNFASTDSQYYFYLMQLHINIEDLLHHRSVESDRIEFKEGWNPDAIYRSICAFANDFENTGGGYIIVGIVEENGVAKRPVKGLSVPEIAAGKGKHATPYPHRGIGDRKRHREKGRL